MPLIRWAVLTTPLVAGACAAGLGASVYWVAAIAGVAGLGACLWVMGLHQSLRAAERSRAEEREGAFEALSRRVESLVG